MKDNEIMKIKIELDTASANLFRNIEDSIAKLAGTREQHYEIESLLGKLEYDIDWLKKELTKFYD